MWPRFAQGLAKEVSILFGDPRGFVLVFTFSATGKGGYIFPSRRVTSKPCISLLSRYVET